MTDWVNSPGPLKVWHGEPDIATVSNDAGELGPKFGIENMFDESLQSWWIFPVFRHRPARRHSIFLIEKIMVFKMGIVSIAKRREP